MASKQSGSRPAAFAMIGLGVMGRNLALNVEEHGFSVAVWNLEKPWTEKFVAENPGKALVPTSTLQELVAATERPRRIMMMITAGKPVDLTLSNIQPYLEEGDILIDGGNSWYVDTQRREEAMRKAGFGFVGCGVSGGEEGARHGPSLMPGGPARSYERLQPVLEAIAAKTDSGPCVTHVGPDGAGHFSKMVHNGIEYGDMQLIAEAYDLLHRGAGLEADKLAAVFEGWNEGPLESFLIELTSRVFRVKDGETGRPLVDLVEDKAGQKGTGKWTTQVALDLAVPVPTISASVDARVLSSMKDERVRASKAIAGLTAAPGQAAELIGAVRDALLASKICSYAQGLHLIRAGSDANKWGVKLGELARIWKGGCIIRARLLDAIMRAFERETELPNLLLDEELGGQVKKAEAGWRKAVCHAQAAGIPVPAMAASLSYFDSYRTARLPQNLTQAQRDAFGSHTYERADHPERGFIHTDWLT